MAEGVPAGGAVVGAPGAWDTGDWDTGADVGVAGADIGVAGADVGATTRRAQSLSKLLTRPKMLSWNWFGLVGIVSLQSGGLKPATVEISVLQFADPHILIVCSVVGRAVAWSMLYPESFEQPSSTGFEMIGASLPNAAPATVGVQTSFEAAETVAMRAAANTTANCMVTRWVVLETGWC